MDPREEHRPQPGVGPGGPKVRPGVLPPLMEGRGDRGVVGGVRDQWAEREREMERRERTRAEREWDRDKVRDFGGKPGEERERGRRSRSLDRERRRKERDGKEKKTDKKGERREGFSALQELLLSGSTLKQTFESLYFYYIMLVNTS